MEYKKLILSFAIIILSGINLHSTNAYVYLKNRINPLYITDIKFFYYLTLKPVPALIFSFKEQRGKFQKYIFDEVREIDFDKVVGHKNLYPVFLIKVYLKRGGYYIPGFCLPLMKITGYLYNRKWEYYMQLDTEYEENAHNLKKILFFKDRLR